MAPQGAFGSAAVQATPVWVEARLPSVTIPLLDVQFEQVFVVLFAVPSESVFVKIRVAASAVPFSS